MSRTEPDAARRDSSPAAGGSPTATIASGRVPLATASNGRSYSLLSTAGPLSEAAFFERIAAMFTGPDLPDEALVRACLESYRSPPARPTGSSTDDDVLRRSPEHSELLARLADAWHRLGCGLDRAPGAGRRIGDGASATGSTSASGRATSALSRAAEDLDEVDCIWYVRGKIAFLFEVEWTAMLGEPSSAATPGSHRTTGSSDSS